MTSIVLSRRKLLVGSAGFALAAGSGLPRPARARSKTPITLTIHFYARGDHGGYYLARERGYYDQADLDVDIRHVLGNGLALQALTAGSAQFVHADLVQMIQLQGRSPEPQMRSMAIACDKLSLSMFYVRGRGINRPQDLAGRRIVDSAGSTAPLLFRMYAEANRFDPNTVTWTNVAAAAKLGMVLRGAADATPFYLVGTAAARRNLPAGQEIGTFVFGDSLPIYGDGIVTRESFFRENREAAERFIRATMRGFKEAFAEPAAAVEAALKHAPEIRPDQAREELEILAGIALGPAQHERGIGHHDPVKMAATYEAVRSALGQPISRPVEDLYTNVAI